MNDATSENTSVEIWLPIGVGIVLMLLDFAYEKHSHIHFADWFNFYGFVALVATLAICVTSTVLRKRLSRSEEYDRG